MVISIPTCGRRADIPSQKYRSLGLKYRNQRNYPPPRRRPASMRRVRAGKHRQTQGWGRPRASASVCQCSRVTALCGASAAACLCPVVPPALRRTAFFPWCIGRTAILIGGGIRRQGWLMVLPDRRRGRTAIVAPAARGSGKFGRREERGKALTAGTAPTVADHSPAWTPGRGGVLPGYCRNCRRYCPAALHREGGYCPWCGRETIHGQNKAVSPRDSFTDPARESMSKPLCKQS
jgi:hypothetical protein